MSNWDIYSAAPLADVSDVDEIHTDGVAFGMDTNVGTPWLQGAGRNLKLTL